MGTGALPVSAVCAGGAEKPSRAVAMAGTEESVPVLAGDRAVAGMDADGKKLVAATNAPGQTTTQQRYNVLGGANAKHFGGAATPTGLAPLQDLW